jgi:HTH-type transcriptional regulator/antitoxin HigA
MIMDIKPIRTGKDYRRALKKIEALMDSKPRSPSGDMLDVLTTLVEAYEARRFPIAPPDPIEAIKFRIEQLGLSTNDLAPYLGGRSRVNEILKRRRKLTVAMMKSLHRNLGVPAEALLS